MLTIATESLECLLVCRVCNTCNWLFAQAKEKDQTFLGNKKLFT